MLAALLLVAASHGSLNFVEDDYSAAVARARREHKPVFVDFWATWCHSCLSMQRYVLSDPGMKQVAGDVVWLSIETEQDKNRVAVEKFPLDGWPTFLLIDPADQMVIARWLGSGSVQDMRNFVQEGVRSYRAKGGRLEPAAAAQRDGDQARMRNDFKASAGAYAKAVALTKAKDPARPARLTLYLSALRKLKTPEALKTCVKTGLEEMQTTGDTSLASDFASYADSCGEALPKDDPDRVKVRAAAMARIKEVLGKEGAALAADDRSDALATLAGMYDDENRHEEAVAAMKERAAVLEKAADGAPDPTMASTFDAHRTDTYLFLKQPEKAEALLAQREKEMPGDYNPPARLARVLFEEKKLADAESAVDRALAKMTRGQRRVGILGLKAKILTAQGKPTEAVLREQLDVLRSLPATQRNPDAEKRIEADLGKKKTASN